MNMCLEWLRKFLIKYFVDSIYCVGYRQSGNFWDETESRFHTLKPTFRYWYADPIPVKIDDTMYVFVEKYDRFREKGYIGLSKLQTNGHLSRPKTILKEGIHLSFPNIILFNNQYYMIPEASETRRIEVYKMQDSPYAWSHYYSMEINEKVVDIVYDIVGDTIFLWGSVLKEDNPRYTRGQIIYLKNLDNIKRISYGITYKESQYSLKSRSGGNIIERGKSRYCILQESTEDIYGKSLILGEIEYLGGDGIKKREISYKSVENIEVHLPRSLYKKIGTHTYGKWKEEFEVVDISAAKISIVPLLRYLKGDKRSKKL